MSGEKKHEPTQKKLADARKDGQIPRTKDLGAWLSIAASVAVIPIVITIALPGLQSIFTTSLPTIVANPDPGHLVEALRATFFRGALSLVPLAVVSVVIVVVSSGLQGGINVATKSLKPKLDKLNPINGFKQMFSLKTLWEAAKAVIKTGVLAGTLWYTISGMVPLLVAAGATHLSSVVSLTGQGVIDVVRTTVLVGLVLAVIDYIVTRKQMHKKLRMSDHDLKEEHKQAEGDPLLKSAIKSRQIAMSRNRMMAAVGDADVVMVNPTHIAVALRYDPEKAAPVVVAKGQGAIALRIREEATKHHVPIVQDIPLARALYYSCEIDQFIPADLYTAVATVLAFVLKLSQSPAPWPLPPDAVHHLPGGAPDVPEHRTERANRRPRIPRQARQPQDAEGDATR